MIKNRNISFRAWDEQRKIMHNNFQFIRSGIEGNDWIIFVSDQQPIGGKVEWEKNPHFSQQLKIMQGTGLKDSCGKEIFEGDIIEFGQDKTRCLIEYKDGGFGYFYLYEFHSFSGHKWLDRIFTKVIGNIFENPELLEIKNAKE